MKRLLLVVGCIILLAVLYPYIQAKISERFASTVDPKLTLQVGAFRNALKDFSSRSVGLMKNINKLQTIIDPAKHNPVLKSITDSLTSYFPSVTGLSNFFIDKADKDTVQAFANSLRNSINDISKDILATKGNDATFKVKLIESSIKKIIDAGNSLVTDAAKAQKTEADRQKVEKVKQAQLDKAKEKAQKELDATNKKAQDKLAKEQKAKEAAIKKAEEVAAARKKAIADNVAAAFSSIKAIPTSLFQQIFFLTQPVVCRVFLQKGMLNVKDIVASFTVSNNDLLIDNYASRAQTTFSNIPTKPVKEMFQQAPAFTPGFYLKHLQSQLYVGRNLTDDGSIASDFSNKITKFSPYTYSSADMKVGFALSSQVLTEKKSGNCVAILGDFTKTLGTIIELIQANTIHVYKSEIFENTKKILDTVALLPANIQTSIADQTAILREKNLVITTSKESKIVNAGIADIQKAGDKITQIILKSQFLPVIKSNNEQVLQAWEPDWFQYITNVIGVAPSVDCRVPLKMDDWDGPIGAFTYNDNGVAKVMEPLPDAFSPFTPDAEDPYIPENIFEGRPIRLATPTDSTDSLHKMIKIHDEQTSNFYKNKVKAILQSLNVKGLAIAARISNPQKMQSSNVCGPQNGHAVCPSGNPQQCCNADGTCSVEGCSATRSTDLQGYDGALFDNPDLENYTSNWTYFEETYNEPSTWIVARVGSNNAQPFVQGLSLDGRQIIRANSKYNAERLLAKYTSDPSVKVITVNDPENASGSTYWANQSYLALSPTNYNYLTPVIQVVAQNTNVVVGNFRLTSKGNLELFGTPYPTLLDNAEEAGLAEVFGLDFLSNSQGEANGACSALGATLASRDQLAEWYRSNSRLNDTYYLGDSSIPYAIDSRNNYESQKVVNANYRVCTNKDNCESNVVQTSYSQTTKGLVRDKSVSRAKALCYGIKPPKSSINKTQPFSSDKYSKWSEWLAELNDDDVKAGPKQLKTARPAKTSVPRSLVYNNWRDWNSFDSVPITSLKNNIPYQSALAKDPTRTNFFPFKIVTLEYLKSKGYITDPDGVNCDYGWLTMARIDIPNTSPWVAVGDHFTKYSADIDPSQIPVLLVYNKKQYSVPIDAGSWSGISDSWKCGSPDQLRWSVVFNDQNYGPNSQYAVLGCAITRYSKGQNPIAERGYDKPLYAVNKLYLNKIGANDWDSRWTMGDEHSGCGKDHHFYFTTPFCTATLNSNNFCSWCNGNKPFWDIVPQKLPLPTSGGL